MTCRACDCAETTVLSTERRGNKVARRRQCNACGERWTTYEVHEADHCAMSAALQLMSTMKTFFQEHQHGSPAHR